MDAALVRSAAFGGGPRSAGILASKPRVALVRPFILSHRAFARSSCLHSVSFACLEVSVLVLLAHRLVEVVEGNIDDLLVVVLPERLKSSLVLADVEEV